MGSVCSSTSKKSYEEESTAFVNAASKLSMPPVYNPPLLNPEFLKLWCGVFKMNVLSHRNTLCGCLTKPTAACCFSCNGIDVFSLSDADEAFKRLLKRPNSNCPDFMKGVWWQQDCTASNQFLTWQDAEWVTKTSAVKRSHYNWSSDANNFRGSLSSILSYGSQRIEVLDNGKWVWLGSEKYGSPEWMYVMQEGEVLRRPDGSTVPCDPGDMVRVDYKDPYDPSSEIVNQYRARCVARLDESGALIKTAAYDEMVRLALAPDPHKGFCCNYCLCNLTYKEIAEDLVVLSDQQAIIYYPPALDVPANEQES